MHGSCKCNNFRIDWQTVDYSVVPRRCLCSYCASKDAAYVSKAGTRVQVSILNEGLHRVVRHGSGSASFHECSHCGDLVLVTVVIQGDMYGALNVQCLEKKQVFSPAVDIDFSDQSPGQKLLRWRQNWCCPVHFLEHPGST